MILLNRLSISFSKMTLQTFGAGKKINENKLLNNQKFNKIIFIFLNDFISQRKFIFFEQKTKISVDYAKSKQIKEVKVN